MGDYRFVDHTQVCDLTQQITLLEAVAFAEYEGSPTFDEDFTEWYLRRPGSTADLCVAALDDEQMVSVVLVAIQPLQLGGKLLDCGIIDSIATHPQHRRQGLARKLMEMAHAKMRLAGADAAVLYTNPEDYPYRFYQRLGYQTRAVCQMLEGARPAAKGPLRVRPAQALEHQAIAGMLNRFYSAHEGYAPLNAELWEWHKVARPLGMEPLLLVAEAAGEPAATCTYAEVPVLLKGETVTVAALSDFAYDAEACQAAEALVSLLATTPQGTVVCLLDKEDPLAELYEKAGFTKAVSEVSMVLPFSKAAHEAMAAKSGPWYVMVESVIGV